MDTDILTIRLALEARRWDQMVDRIESYFYKRKDEKKANLEERLAIARSQEGFFDDVEHEEEKDKNQIEDYIKEYHLTPKDIFQCSAEYDALQKASPNSKVSV